MKHIYIIRHAKSSWSHPNLSDRERPLNKRGLHDAPKMAQLLANSQLDVPQYIYSSHANRALSTAEYFHSALELNSEIDVRHDLYHGDESDIMHVIHTSSEDINSIAIFGHNPTFTFFSNKFMEDFIDNLPTCGIIHLKSSSVKWEDVDISNTTAINQLFPKQLIY